MSIKNKVTAKVKRKVKGAKALCSKCAPQMVKTAKMVIAVFALALMAGCNTPPQASKQQSSSLAFNLDKGNVSITINVVSGQTNAAAPGGTLDVSLVSQAMANETGGDETLDQTSSQNLPIAPLSGDKALDTLGTLGASALTPGAGAAVKAGTKLITDAVGSDAAKEVSKAEADACKDGKCTP